MKAGPLQHHPAAPRAPSELGGELRRFAAHRGDAREVAHGDALPRRREHLALDEIGRLTAYLVRPSSRIPQRGARKTRPQLQRRRQRRAVLVEQVERCRSGTRCCAARSRTSTRSAGAGGFSIRSPETSARIVARRPLRPHVLATAVASDDAR